jgi:putative membrane protein
MMPSEPIPSSSPEAMPEESLSPFPSPDSTKVTPRRDLPLFEGRLHPLTLAFGIGRGLRGSLPILPLIYFGKPWMAFGVLAMMLGGSVLTALLRYFSFTYRIEAGELITSGGIISRNVRHIPLDRIQEIQVEQGVIHRILGVVDARIETAGGGQGAEAVLSVLKQEEVDRLRTAIFSAAAVFRDGRESATPLPDGTAAPVPARDEPSTLLYRLRTRDLLQAGLTTNHLVSLLVALGAIWNWADNVLPESFYHEWVYQTLERGVQSADPAQLDPAAWASGLIEGWLLPALFLVAGLLLVALLGAIFSTARAILLFHGFELTLRGEDLHRCYGLLTRRSTSLPRHRIQVLKIEQTLLRRVWGLATLRVDTAGNKLDNEEGPNGRDTLLPITPIAEVPPLLSLVFPTLSLPSQDDWHLISRHAIWRGIIAEMFGVILVTGLLFWREGWWGILVLPLLAFPVCWRISRAQYRGRGYAICGDFVHTRRGWLGRSIHIVPIEKIQDVEIVQGPIDRLFGLATIEIDTAGQIFTGGGPRIRFLPLGEALSLAHQLTQQATLTRYRW